MSFTLMLSPTLIFDCLQIERAAVRQPRLIICYTIFEFAQRQSGPFNDLRVEKIAKWLCREIIHFERPM